MKILEMSDDYVVVKMLQTDVAKLSDVVDALALNYDKIETKTLQMGLHEVKNIGQSLGSLIDGFVQNDAKQLIAN